MHELESAHMWGSAQRRRGRGRVEGASLIPCRVSQGGVEVGADKEIGVPQHHQRGRSRQQGSIT